MVCVDTSFLVALIRRDLTAEKKLEDYEANGVEVSTAPITACELFKGAYRSERREVEIKKVKDILTRLELLNFSVEACERYGKLVNELRLAGIPIGDLDTMIASLAMVYGEPLLTSNRAHFERVPGLIVETW